MRAVDRSGHIGGLPRVLVVDDDEIVLSALAATLEWVGYEVKTARNGHEAAQALRRREYAVLITDVKMPGLSGIQLLERVRSQTPRTRVLVVSGYPSREIEEEASAKGAALFLAKPVDTTRLRECVDALVAADEVSP